LITQNWRKKKKKKKQNKNPEWAWPNYQKGGREGGKKKKKKEPYQILLSDPYLIGPFNPFIHSFFLLFCLFG
jgi:hypothetical protein